MSNQAFTAPGTVAVRPLDRWSNSLSKPFARRSSRESPAGLLPLRGPGDEVKENNRQDITDMSVKFANLAFRRSGQLSVCLYFNIMAKYQNSNSTSHDRPRSFTIDVFESGRRRVDVIVAKSARHVLRSRFELGSFTPRCTLQCIAVSQPLVS